jgi:hypothetical protein
LADDAAKQSTGSLSEADLDGRWMHQRNRDGGGLDEHKVCPALAHPAEFTFLRLAAKVGGWTGIMVRSISIALLIMMCLPAIAETPSHVLRSLPAAVQKEIGEIRNACPSNEKNTSGDGGLQTFTVSGAQAVLIDELNFCGEGRTCIHSVNCATGYTHQVEIYVRRRNVWTKSFSVNDWLWPRHGQPALPCQ